MKYLKKIKLKNFQSHSNTELDFTPGLNVIVGESDSGKSAIIRAIKWALYNEPLGDFFIKEGEHDCSVSLTFSDGTVVKRLRTRSKNQYIINPNTEEELILQGFGTGVPEEVVEATGIFKIPLDSDKSNTINLAEQLEGPFLLSESTSTRAGAIGRLIGVDVIDDALRETLRDLRNINKDEKDLSYTIEDLTKELEEYDYLDELEERLLSLEKIQTEIKEKENLLKQIQSLKVTYINTLENINKLKEILTKLNYIEELESSINKIEVKKSRYIILKNKSKQYTNVLTNIKNNKNILDNLKNIENIDYKHTKLVKYIDVHQKLLALKNNYNNNQKEINSLNNINKKLSYIEDIDENINLINEKINAHKFLTNIFSDYLKIRKSLDIGNKYILNFTSLDNVSNKYDKLLEKIKLLKKLKELENKKQSINKQQIGLRKQYKEIQEDVDRKLKIYEEYLNKLELCPFCFSDLDDDKIQHILEHYE